MKYFLIITLIAIVAGLFFIGCSDLKENINQPAVLGIHAEGINNPNSDAFHGKIIAGNNYRLVECQQCHTANYSGASIGGNNISSCLTCHSQSNGPEACNTCHGDFADSTMISPPTALNGSIETTYPGVGAHVKHLFNNNLGSSIPCSTCHSVPQSFLAAGHLGNDNKAEIIFNLLSVNQGVTPAYDFANNTCSNSYCHGNFTFYRDSSAFQFAYTGETMVGNNQMVKWNKVDGTQAPCGSCHNLPPVGHIASTLTTCVNCHQGVINALGEIIDSTKHINGSKNVFGN